MERALARWPWPQLLRRTGAPTRESAHRVVSSGMTSPFAALPSRTTCGCPAPAEVLAAHLHLPRTQECRFLGSHQHTKQPLGETPPHPGSGRRKLKRTRPDQPAAPLDERLKPMPYTSTAPSTGLSLHRPLSSRHTGVPAAHPVPVHPWLCPPQATPSLKLFPSLLIPMSHLPPPRTRPQVDPWLGRLKNWMEEAEEPPRTTALDQALLPDSRLDSPDEPVASLLVRAGATPGILRGTGPWTQAQPPAPLEPLHSHGDALHTLPRDRLDPKTLDPDCPCEEGRALLSLPCSSHPPFD